MISNTQKHKYQAYASATQTVARTKQIVLLYDGVIRFLQQAKEAIREKRIEDRYKMLVKASDVIMGLQGCLDFDNGGDIARILYSFYTSIDSRIFSIHRTNSQEICDELIAELKKMRDVWHEIDQTDARPAEQPVAVASEPASTPASGSDQGVVLSA